MLLKGDLALGRKHGTSFAVNDFSLVGMCLQTMLTSYVDPAQTPT